MLISLFIFGVSFVIMQTSFLIIFFNLYSQAVVKVVLVFVQNLYNPFGASSEVLYLVAGKAPQQFNHHLLIQSPVCPGVKVSRVVQVPKAAQSP